MLIGFLFYSGIQTAVMQLFCFVLFCFVLFCFVLFCFVLVWFGLVWFGLVWFGLVWFGLVWLFFVTGTKLRFRSRPPWTKSVKFVITVVKFFHTC